MKISDFKVGQTVYIELVGNAARGKKKEKLIEEWEVTSVGRKYIFAKKKDSFMHPIKFEESIARGLWVLRDSSSFAPEYYLYYSKEYLRKEKLYSELKDIFDGYTWHHRLSLKQLENIYKAVYGDLLF